MDFNMDVVVAKTARFVLLRSDGDREKIGKNKVSSTGNVVTFDLSGFPIKDGYDYLIACYLGSIVSASDPSVAFSQSTVPGPDIVGTLMEVKFLVWPLNFSPSSIYLHSSLSSLYSSTPLHHSPRLPTTFPSLYIYNILFHVLHPKQKLTPVILISLPQIQDLIALAYIKLGNTSDNTVPQKPGPPTDLQIQPGTLPGSIVMSWKPAENAKECSFVGWAVSVFVAEGDLKKPFPFLMNRDTYAFQP